MRQFRLSLSLMSPTMTSSLPVFKILQNTFRLVWNKKERMLQAMAIPILIPYSLLFTLVWILPEIFPEESSFEISTLPTILLSILLIAAVGVPYIWFAEICHRLALLGDTGVPPYGLRSWTRREWYFLFWTALLPCVFLLSIFLSPIVFGLAFQFDFTFGTYSTWLGDLDTGLWVVLLLTVPSLYFLSRLSLILPATAVDRNVSIEWAWKFSRGNGWRLTLVIGCLPLGFDFLTDFLWEETSTWLEELAGFILLGILLIFEIVALSLSYQHLAKYEALEPEEDIL